MEAIAPPLLETSGLTVSAVARRLGVAPATLRTWDRRYGMSPSLRTSGDHRRYTAADLALLQQMRHYMISGMPPGDAAAAARQDTGRDDPRPRPSAVPGSASFTGTGAAMQRGLVRAASAMDAAAASDVIRTAIERNGTNWAWDEVVAPTLRAVGVRGADGSGQVDGVDIEHHLSYIVAAEFSRRFDVPQPVNARPILLSCAPEEQHALPLFALAAALAERGIVSRILGANTPDEALAAAVRRLGPLAVFIWAHACPRTDLDVAVPAIRPAPLLIVGGPGWLDHPLPPQTGYPQRLAEAVASIVAATRPPLD